MTIRYPAVKPSRKTGGRGVNNARARRLPYTFSENGDLYHLMEGNSHVITERKQMEQKLADEATRRRILVEQSRDGIVILDQNGKVYEANRRFAEMLGYSPEEVLKLNVSDWEFLYPPEQVREMIRTVDEAGDQFITRHRRKDGTTYDVEISTNGAMFAGRKLIFCVCRDITERKVAEEKHQAILQTALDGFWICDLNGKFLEVNDSYCTMTGYTREELLKMSIMDIEAIENPEATSQRIEKIIEQGGDRFETRHRCKDGRILNIEISVTYHNIGEGQLTVFVHDITERKKVEEKLRLLSSVTQQVSDAIMITDPKFKITYVNRAAQDMFGYTLDEIRGKELAAFHITPPSQKTNRVVTNTIQKGKVWYQTIPKKRKDGSIIICDCHLSPLYDDKGQICSYIDVQRDVTAQKEVETKLHEQRKLIESILATMREGVLVIDSDDRVILANTSVHRIFHRRPNALNNKLLKDIIPVEPLLKLYHRVKLGQQEDNTLEFMYSVKNIDKIIACGAVNMDEERTLLTFSDVSREREEKEKLYLTDRLASIGEMAVGLTHELNNPLTGILSLSQLLIDSNITPETREDLQCINSEARRAANIVKNVLLFTRNNNYENGQASVNEVVIDVLRLREYEEKANNIKVVANLQENLPEVQIDRFQLQQIFLNIILNAEAAIKEVHRPGLLTVTTEKANHHVNILFSDNGCGIKKNVLPRIFDPFFTTKEIGKGTGLGLSICFGIVSQHRGKISVRTRLNKGTTFTVRMPAVLEENI
jgi:PAS domain S-box-containing protein